MQLIGFSPYYKRKTVHDLNLKNLKNCKPSDYGHPVGWSW